MVHNWGLYALPLYHIGFFMRINDWRTKVLNIIENDLLRDNKIE